VFNSYSLQLEITKLHYVVDLICLSSKYHPEWNALVHTAMTGCAVHVNQNYRIKLKLHTAVI